MILTVQLPTLQAILYGKYKNRISHVQADVPLVTTVYKIRRLARNGKYDADLISAEAFIPEHYRSAVDPKDWRWVDKETLRVMVNIKDNRKTLAAFLGSYEPELDVREQ